MDRFTPVQIELTDGYTAVGFHVQPAVNEPASAVDCRSQPAGTIGRGAVLFLHGIQSHSGWFERSARALSDAGYHVLLMDRRGSGANRTDRGHAESADQLVSDVLVAKEFLKTRSGFPDCHFTGVSWGGKLAVAAYVADPNGVRSLSLVTPGLFPLSDVPRAERFRIGLAMLSEPARLFDIPLNRGELLTRHAGKAGFIDSDPLTLRQATAGFYLASRRMDARCEALRDAPPVPVFVMLAGEEFIIDNGATTEFIESLGWSDVSIKCFESARHALEFDALQENFPDDLVAWIDARNTL